jgi:hypothetical protein
MDSSEPLGVASDLAVPGLEPAKRHHIDPSAEQRCKGVLQFGEVEQRAAGPEVDQEVDVAVQGLLAAGDRAEQRNGATLVAHDECLDPVAVRLDLRSQRQESSIRHERQDT